MFGARHTDQSARLLMPDRPALTAGGEALPTAHGRAEYHAGERTAVRRVVHYGRTLYVGPQSRCSSPRMPIPSFSQRN